MKTVVYKVTYERNSMFAEGKYRREYLRGKVTRAMEGTLGLTCFETKEDVAAFCGANPSFGRVLKVRGIGKPSHPKAISPFYQERALDDFYEGETVPTVPPPSGTVYYPAVLVLE